MMKRLLLTSAALIAAPVSAEPWTVGQQTIAYTAAHPLQAHDAASAYTNSEPADIADNFTTATWIHTGSPPSPAGQFDAPGTGSEAKARFDCNDAFEANDDPIIAPGVQNGASHKHRFFGNLGAAAAPYNATYASLRASGNSTCYGGPINRSLYWEPEMFKALSNGAVVGIIPKNVVTYYECGALADIGSGKISDPLVCSRWPRGISMIFGFNMSDPTDSRTTNAIAAANAASTPGRYSAISATSAGGFRAWLCLSVLSGPTEAAYLSADGGVTSPLNCTPGTDLIAEIVSYPCWDGVNLHSPDGRAHFMPLIRDNTLSKDVCPDNWVRVPQFRAKVTFNQTGVADYKTWYASSDRMDANPANWTKNGESFHADFIPAWSYGTAAAPGPMVKFFVHCDGMSITISGTTLTGDAHECGYGRITLTENLFVNEASPDASSPNPIVNLSPDQRGKRRYAPQTGSSIPGTIHNNTSGMNDMPMNDTQLAGAAPISFNLRNAGR